MIVAAAGEVLWDDYPGKRCIGGAPANVLRHAVKFGYEGILISRVGDDADGSELLRALSGRIDTGAVQVDRDRPTGRVAIRLDAGGNPTFACSENTAFDALEYDAAMESAARKADCIITGTLSQRTPRSRRTIQTFIARTGGLVLFDVNFRAWDEQVESAVFETLPRTDILKMNLDEMHKLQKVLGGPEPDQRFLLWLTESYGIGLAAVTHGERGCVITDGVDCLTHPGFVVKAVDTTGSGDAFCAGLLHGRLSGMALAETADLANAMGAFTATKSGAVPDYTAKTLAAFRRNTHGGML